jgi:hypothetical protein
VVFFALVVGFFDAQNQTIAGCIREIGHISELEYNTTPVLFMLFWGFFHKAK